jgi:hypothetical protein
MRPLIALAGGLIAAIGVVLLFLPVVPQPSAVVPAATGPPTYDVGKIPGASLSGVIPITITWTSTTFVTIIGGVCANPCTQNSSLSDVTVQQGTKGSFTVNQPVDGSTFVGANTTGNTSGTVTFKLTSALTTAASLLIVAGIIVVLVGVLLGRPKSKQPTEAEPASVGAPAPSAGPGSTAPATVPE